MVQAGLTVAMSSVKVNVIGLNVLLIIDYVAENTNCTVFILSIVYASCCANLLQNGRQFCKLNTSEATDNFFSLRHKLCAIKDSGHSIIHISLTDLFSVSSILYYSMALLVEIPRSHFPHHLTKSYHFLTLDSSLIKCICKTQSFRLKCQHQWQSKWKYPTLSRSIADKI